MDIPWANETMPNVFLHCNVQDKITNCFYDMPRILSFIFLCPIEIKKKIEDLIKINLMSDGTFAL